MDDYPLGKKNKAKAMQITGNANAVGSRNIIQLVKAESGSTIHDVVQQVFIGDYERLGDAYISCNPSSIFERVELQNFEGREWLLAEVDAFLRENDRGYFILEAEAGLGKTTFLAWLVRERGYIHHFSELRPGTEGVGMGLKSLAAQIVLACHLNTWEADGVLPGAAAQPGFFYELLKQAAGKLLVGEQIVIVVDALDEARAPAQDHLNVLGLPKVLPKGVFIIASQRPVPIRLEIDTTPRVIFRLTAERAENQIDMRHFLEKAVAWPGVAKALQISNYTSEHFTAKLLEKCRGGWIYLHYIVHAIESGERSPLNLDRLPDGMMEYYVQYWRDWRDAHTDKTSWDSIALPLLTTLAAAEEPLTAERLKTWANVNLPIDELDQLLNEEWRPYLSVTEQDGKDYYRFYHATLREFFEGKGEQSKQGSANAFFVDKLAKGTRSAHSRLADRYLNAWGGLENNLPELQVPDRRDLDDGYGLRHMAAHLESALRSDDLHRLLAVEFTEAIEVDEIEFVPANWLTRLTGHRRVRIMKGTRTSHQLAWLKAQEQGGDVAGFLDDVARAWRLAELSERGKSIGLQCRYALLRASADSLLSNIPAKLLLALVEKRVWTPLSGLVHARLLNSREQRSEAMTGLSPYLSEPLRTETLQDALTTAWGIEDISDRMESLERLAPHLSESLLHNVIRMVQEISDEHDRAKILRGLAPHLPQPLLRHALEIGKAVDYEVAQVEALSGLAPYLPKSLGRPLIYATLKLAREIKDGYWRAEALSQLIPCLPASLRTDVLQEALAASRESYSPHRAQLLAKLIPFVPDLQQRALAREAVNVLAVSGQIRWVEVLVKFIPYLPETWFWLLATRGIAYKHDKEQEQMMSALASHYAKSNRPRWALAAVRAIRSVYDRPHALVKLAPFLSERLRNKVLFHTLAEARQSLWLDGWANMLAVLSPQMPGPWRRVMVHEALMATRKIEKAETRAKVLTHLIPHLPDSLLLESLTAVGAIPYGRYQEAVSALKSQLDEPASPDSSLAAVAAIGWDDHRIKSLLRLSVYLSGPIRRKAVDEALALWTKEDRGKWYYADADLIIFIGQLAARLPEVLRHPILTTAQVKAQQIADPEVSASALIKLVPVLSGVSQDELLDFLMEFILKIEDGTKQTKLLIELFHLMVSLNIYAEALIVAQKIPIGQERIDVLVDFALGLASQQKEVLEADRPAPVEKVQPAAPIPLVSPLQLQNEALRLVLTEARGNSLIRLVDRLIKTGLTPQLVDLGYPELALAAIREIPSYERCEALDSLVRQFMELSHFDSVLALVEEIPSFDGKGFERLIQQLVELDHPELALAVVWKIPGYKKIDRLMGLAPHLPEPVLRDALAMVQSFSISDQEILLVGLIPQLAKLGYPEEAWAMVQDFDSDYRKSEVLAELALHLPESLVRATLTMLEIPRYFASEPDRAAWARLIAQLAKLGYAKEALSRVRDFHLADKYKADQYKSEALTELAHYLPEPLLRQALPMAEELPDFYREKPVLGLAAQFFRVNRSEDAQALIRMLPISEYRKDDLLEDLALELVQLGNLEEALLVVQQISSENTKHIVAANLAPHLTSHKDLAKALSVVPSLSKYLAQLRDDVLALALQFVKLGHPEEALAVAREIPKHQDYSETEVFTRLANQLIDEGYQQIALAAVQEISGAFHKADLLIKLSPRLVEPLQSQALREVFQIAQSRGTSAEQIQVLSDLAQQMAALNYLENALIVAREIKDDHIRMLTLVGLASQLANLHRQEEAWATARAIENSSVRLKVLINLSSRPASLDPQQEELTPQMIVEQFSDPSSLDEAIFEMLERLPLTTLNSLWCENLHILASGPRDKLLSDLRAWSPVIFSYTLRKSRKLREKE